ncbi:MAG: NADH pyrophosphatase [Phycisphaerae bacterium]|nr:NADH pyrophosphatase [Phycisphaerae bacterium]
MADLSSIAPKRSLGQGIVAIIEREGRYLMIQRAHHLRAGGKWCFVGGGIHPGEAQEVALAREVMEEVGLAVRPVRKVWECFSYNREWLLHSWTVELLSQEVKPNAAEVADFRWLTVDEIQRWPNLMPSVLDYFRSLQDSAANGTS